MRSLRPLLAASLALGLGCAQAARQAEMSERGGGGGTSAPIGRVQQEARVLVRRATMEVEVEDVPAAVERATRVARDFEGYVENVTTTEDKRAYVRLRVPSTRLKEALDSVGRLGKVTGRSLSEDDVTVRSVDLEARVTSLRAARDKLRELLSRAVTVADAVAAQAELARVQADLDSLEGQLKALQSSVELSELSVTISRRVVLGPLGLVASAVAKVIGKLFVWR